MCILLVSTRWQTLSYTKSLKVLIYQPLRAYLHIFGVLCIPGNVSEVRAVFKKAALVLFRNTGRGHLRPDLAFLPTHHHKLLHPFIFPFLLCTMELE